MKNFNCDVFIKRASELIFNSGKTQAELVEALGISNGSIANLKNRKKQTPSAETVCILAKYFNVSTDWILGLTDIRSTDKATKEQIYQEGYVAGYNALKNKIQEFTKNI